MSQNPTAKEAPHMFCPSHQGFYFMLSSINSFSGGIHGAAYSQINPFTVKTAMDPSQ